MSSTLVAVSDSVFHNLDLATKALSVVNAELKLAEGTVKLHVAALLKALGVNNRTEAVFAATTQGLVESPSPGASQNRN